MRTERIFLAMPITPEIIYVHCADCGYHIIVNCQHCGAEIEEYSNLGVEFPKKEKRSIRCKTCGMSSLVEIDGRQMP